MIGHVLVQLCKELLIGYGHDGSQTAHLGLGNTIGKDTTVTLRTEGSLCETLLGLDDLGIVGVEHIELELFDLGVGKFRIHVSAAGVLLEVTRIEGIVFEIVLGNVHRGLGSRRDLTDGDGLLSILTNHMLIKWVGLLVEIVGIFGPEIEESLDGVKGLGAHFAFQRAFDPSPPWKVGFLRSFLWRFDEGCLFFGDGSELLEFLSVFLAVVGGKVSDRAGSCRLACGWSKLGNNSSSPLYSSSPHHCV